MALIEDLDRGVLDRFLVSPVSRGALIAGRLGYQFVVIVIQSLIVIGLGYAVGADFPGGVAGVLLLLLASVLLVAGFGALSIAFGLLMRKGVAGRRRPADASCSRASCRPRSWSSAWRRAGSRTSPASTPSTGRSRPPGRRWR